MADVAVATFVIGSDAAESVRQQLQSSSATLKARVGHERCDDLSAVAHRFEELLKALPSAFDTSICPPGSSPIRVIWRSRNETAGTLYIARGDQLQTITLLLSGVNRENDVAALEELGRALSPIGAYVQSLAVVRFGGRPIIATFCSQAGGLDQNLDPIQLAFAAVFFRRCGL